MVDDSHVLSGYVHGMDTKENHLDDVARNAAVTRQNALKLLGAVLFGIGLTSLIPGVAEARRYRRPTKRAHRRRKCSGAASVTPGTCCLIPTGSTSGIEAPAAICPLGPSFGFTCACPPVAT